MGTAKEQAIKELAIRRLEEMAIIQRESLYEYLKYYWDKDKEKIDNAVKSGYDVKTIWQYDWEKCDDKKQLIGEILNGTIRQ
jgi:hypothetical protein